MTKRAELAAAELARRGWEIDGSETVEAMKDCAKCGAEIDIEHKYCPHCGEKSHVLVAFAQSSLDDIEAAIVAAMGAGS
jgi:rRNA maturation endonuclease Nob1